MSFEGLKTALTKFHNFFSSRSIKSNFLIAFVFVALFPAVIINFFYYSMMHKEMEDKIQTYSNEIIRQVGQKIDYMLTQTELIEKQIIAVTIASDTSELYGELTPKEKLSLPYKTDKLITNIIRDFQPVSDAYIIEIHGNNYSSNMNRNFELLIKKPWMQNLYDIPPEGIVIPTHDNDYFDINKAGNTFPVISFVKKVNLKKSSNSSETGVVQVDLKYSAIKEIIDSAQIGERSFTLLLDRGGRVIFSENKEDFGRTIGEVAYNGVPVSDILGSSSLGKNNGPFVLEYGLANSQWNMITIMPTDSIFYQLNELKNLSIFIIGVSIIFAFVLSFALSGSVIKPIRRLVKTMKKVENGNFTVTMPEIKYKDLHVLSSSFNVMIKKIDILMKNMIEKETEKTNAQLKALQAQINPHFLYNTLEVVRSIAIENKVQSIAEISKALSKIFRYSINKEKEIVTVEEEIEHIKNYIKIQKFRFGDKLEMFYDLDEEALECKIPRFIIQPLVENSIFHGIETKMGKGAVVISVTKTEDDITIRVKDNGTGIPEKKLEVMNRALKEYGPEYLKENDTSFGIGILNVNIRLKLLFGSRCRLDITSVPLVETTVEIHMPSL